MIRNSRGGAAMLAAMLCVCQSPAANAAAPSLEQEQIRSLQQQLATVQSQMAQLLEQNRRLFERQLELERALAPQASSAAQPPSAQPRASQPSAQGSPTAPADAPGPSSASGAFSNVRLWGYGELYYTRPTRDPAKAQADLARAVFGIGYSFDERTEFNSEFEVEHAVSSVDDVGEFEVEQFYVDRRLNDALTVRAGLFLMPFGLLNEHHEPTNFYGVQRNFVETLIIPSTWREGGFNVHGDTDTGFSWNAGLTTGFDLSKWEYAPESPPYSTALGLEDSDSAPLQSTHQELALANAHDLRQYVAVAGNLEKRDLGSAVTEIKKVLANMPGIPAGAMEYGGLYQQNQEATRNLLMVMLMAILLVFTVLLLEFGSFLEPMAIMLGSLLALLGTVAALYITGT